MKPTGNSCLPFSSDFERELKPKEAKPDLDGQFSHGEQLTNEIEHPALLSFAYHLSVLYFICVASLPHRRNRQGSKIALLRAMRKEVNTSNIRTVARKGGGCLKEHRHGCRVFF